MEKLKQIFKLHWISILGALIVITIVAAGLFNSCGGSCFEQEIGNQTNQANQAARSAANAQNAAINAAIERRTEDALRDKIITPELNRRRRNSENSKAALDTARKKYDEKKNNTSNLSRSDSDNCRELSRLFPNVSFEDCY